MGCLRFIASLIANFCHIKVLLHNQSESKSNHVAGRTTTSAKCQVQKHSNLYRALSYSRVPVNKKKRETFQNQRGAPFFFRFYFWRKVRGTCVDLAMCHRPKWRNRKQEQRGPNSSCRQASQTFSFNETNKSLWGRSIFPPSALTPSLFRP